MFWSYFVVACIIAFFGLIVYAYVDEWLTQRRMRAFNKHVQDDLDLFE